MQHKRLKIAPVAEYRNVALVEHAGNKRAAWRGTEYRTDGLVWLYVRPGQEAAVREAFAVPAPVESTDAEFITTIGLPSERVAKEVLDTVPVPKALFLSVGEINRMLKVTPSKPPARRWDADQGVFVD